MSALCNALKSQTYNYIQRNNNCAESTFSLTALWSNAVFSRQNKRHSLNWKDLSYEHSGGMVKYNPMIDWVVLK